MVPPRPQDVELAAGRLNVIRQEGSHAHRRMLAATVSDMGSLDYLKSQLEELRDQGLLLHPRTLEGPTGARARFDGRDVINLASNNYLGLANHPRLREAAAAAARELGAGTGAVRTISGQMTIHRELERRFAAFKHAEAALMFQSGFTSNAGTVAAILDKEDVIVSDRLNHASIIDRDQGVRAQGC